MGSVCAVVALAAPARAQVSLAERLAEGQPPLVLAHRSAVLGGFPENSLPWIDYGIALGVDVLQVNPQLTADGQYILMHDPTLNRMTDVEKVFPAGPPGGPTRVARGGKDFVRDYRLAEIRKLRLGPGPDGVAHPVPTLGEALDRVGGRVLVSLGLKSFEVDSLAAALAGHDAESLILFQLYYPGTDQSRLRALAEVTGLGVGVALQRSRDVLSDLDAIAAQLGPHLKMVTLKSREATPEVLARAKALTLAVVISGWATGEDFALAERGDPAPWLAVLDRGLSVLTDHPEALLALMGR